MSEEPRLDALDRLRIGVHQQQGFWALEEPPGQKAGKLSARREGYSPQAGRYLHENDREGFEALVRYCKVLARLAPQTNVQPRPEHRADVRIGRFDRAGNGETALADKEWRHRALRVSYRGE